MTKEEIENIKIPKFKKSRKKHWTEIFGNEIERNPGIMLQHGRAGRCKKITPQSDSHDRSKP
jgi:hypothetical protein